MTKAQRIDAVIAKAGGPVKAAAIAGKSRGTIDNWRKDGADPPLEALLPLCVKAEVSLDWIATGYQVRPDLAERAIRVGGLSGSQAGSFEGAEKFVRLMPLQPELPGEVERWNPSEIAVSIEWLQRQSGLTPDTARWATAGDAGMAPLVEQGALLIVDVRPGNPRSGIYTVKVGDDVVARRLHRLPDGTAELVANAEPQWRFSLTAAADGAGMLIHRVIWVGQVV